MWVFVVGVAVSCGCGCGCASVCKVFVVSFAIGLPSVCHLAAAPFFPDSLLDSEIPPAFLYSSWQRIWCHFPSCKTKNLSSSKINPFTLTQSWRSQEQSSSKTSSLGSPEQCVCDQ